MEDLVPPSRAKLGAALLLALAAGCSDPSDKAAQALQPEIDRFAADYIPNGTIRDQAALNQLFLAQEHVRFLRSGGETIPSLQEFKSSIWEPFVKEVLKCYGEEQSEHPDQKDPLINLKEALHRTIATRTGREATYNRDFNSMIDPVVDPLGRLQCRSARTLLLWLAREHIEEALTQEGSKLVVIATDTHTQLGKISADGSLRGYEGTATGAGTVEYGTFEQIKDSGLPIRVLAADHVMAQAILDRRLHPELTVLLDTVQEHFGGSAQGASSNSRETGERWGFSSGKSVPEGDIPMDRREMLTPTMVGNGPRIPSTYAVVETEAQLLSRLSPQERVQVAAFLGHMDYFDDAWERHLLVINNDQLSNSQKEGELRDILNEIRSYWRENGLGEEQSQAVSVLRNHGLEFQRSPAITHDFILQNWKLISRRAQEGR